MARGEQIDEKSDRKMLSLLMQINRGVATGGRAQGAKDPAMTFILNGLGSGAPPKCFDGGGGRENPIAKVMKKGKTLGTMTQNSLAKVLGIKR